MPITSVSCHVIGSNVTCVTDFEGRVTRLICPEYDEPTGICRLRQQASSGGPLSQLLERVAEDTLETRDARCPLGARVAAIVLAFVLASAAASAQETRLVPRAEWGGFPGGALVFTRSTENAVPDFTNYTLGTSFAWNVTPWVAVEGEAGFGVGARRTIAVGGRLMASQPMPDTATYSASIVLNPVGGRRAGRTSRAASARS